MSTEDKISDLTLVKQALSELPYVTTSYAKLMVRYQRLLRHVCTGVLINHSSLDDSVQDVMLKVFHKLSNFEERASFKTWLMKIAVNVCISYNRKALREAGYIVEANDHLKESVASEAVPVTEGDSFQNLIQALNEEERQIITLKFVAEIEFKEIAHILDLGLSATKMRYYRAIEKLKVSGQFVSK